MSKVKTVTKKAMDDPELQDMFNQMVGASDPDPRIVAPKYDDILENAKKIIQILEATFCKSNFISAGIKEEFNKPLSDIAKFVQDGMAELERLTLQKSNGIATGESVKPVNKDPKNFLTALQGLDHGYDLKNLGETYKALKECTTLDKIIIAVRDLRKTAEEDKTTFKKAISDIEEKDKLSDNFIAKCDSDDLVLIPSICGLDFKQLWMHPHCNYDLRRRIVFAFHLMVKRGHVIVQNIMSPDIDVERFSEILIENIDKIRKVLPRCDKAFNKIKQSVSLLKNNFGGYYKDFVISKNPGIIIENFVMDVANDSKADRETTRQFRMIVQFYQKKMQGQVKDPKIQKIFDLVGENLNILEQKTGQTYKKSNQPTSSGSGTPDSDSESDSE